MTTKNVDRLTIEKGKRKKVLDPLTLEGQVTLRKKRRGKTVQFVLLLAHLHISRIDEPLRFLFSQWLALAVAATVTLAY